MVLTKLWIGMRTRNKADAGTDSPIVLIVNNDGRDDLLHHTFGKDTPQEDQERGKANLYDVPDVEPLNIDPANLHPSSVRLGIRGGGEWAPEDVFVFGEENGSPVPLALARDITKVLSTDLDDDDDARLSIPILPVSLGTPTTGIFRVLVLMLTGPEGTNSKLELQVFSKTAGLVVDLDMPTSGTEDGSSQDQQEANQANFYYVETSPPFTPFTKKDISSITLSLKGEDTWLPASFFLFGLDSGVREPGSPLAIVPLVHLPVWELGELSDEENPVVTLPLVPPV